MSSRALKKAQRQASPVQDQTLPQDSGSETESNDHRQKGSLFALLNDEDQTAEISSDEDGKTGEFQVPPGQSKSKQTKKRKKKKKGRGIEVQDDAKASNVTKAEFPEHRIDTKANDSGDDIDRALRDLNIARASGTTEQEHAFDRSTIDQRCKLLSVESDHLRPENEMKRLFGNAALVNEQNQREDHGQQVVARNRGHDPPRNAHNRNLAGLSLKRNVFVRGKEEWPKATSGGLSMEVVKQNPDGTVTYSFVHNSMYQATQREFDICVATMVPERLITLLQLNPYHISTLLQVSEILKQNRQHTEAGDLLDRALFSFGRSVHSTFGKNISEGKARLSFDLKQNREFWLASYRHINNLGMRGLWRTAFEWAKLLLSLDPEQDPYRISFLIDQLALRAGVFQQLLDISKLDSGILRSGSTSKPLNIKLSKVLAYFHLRQSTECRQALEEAVAEFPFAFARLYQSLELSPAPRCVWGSEPLTGYDKLMTELYVLRASDIWKSPEAIAMLTGIMEHLPRPAEKARELPITLDLARHVLLSEEPSLIALLPRDLTSRPSSSSDPVPPTLEETDYPASARDAIAGTQWLQSGDPLEVLAQLDPRLAEAARRMIAEPGGANAEEAPNNDEDGDTA